MRILILYRHFWPDSPPYATMLRMLGAHLVGEGHLVTVWSEEPCYKTRDAKGSHPAREDIDGVRVERFARLPFWRTVRLVRLLDQILFPVRVAARAVLRRLKGDRYDLVWTATIPPIASGLVARLAARLFGARLLYHCQDLYPEIACQMGIWRKNGLIYAVANAVERATRARADLLVTLSEDMANTVRALAEPRRLAIINNFALDGPVPHGRLQPDSDLQQRTQLIFAGNLGQFQRLDVVIDAMRQLDAWGTDLELVLMGEGKALPHLRRRAEGLANVRFEPHRPFADAKVLIAAADFGLVSLEPGIYRLAFPSKTMTYLSLGLPILTIVEPDSELAAMIEREDLGWVPPQQAPEAIAATLAEMHAAGPPTSKERARISAWAESHASFANAAASWSAEIARLSAFQKS